MTTHSYPAVLRDGRLEWTGNPPPDLPDGVGVPVQVTLAGPPADLSDAERGRRLVAVLEQLAAMGTGEKYGDPVEWQREQRRDRPLPGRGP